MSQSATTEQMVTDNGPESDVQTNDQKDFEEPQEYGGWPIESMKMDAIPEIFRKQLECPICMMIVKDAVQCTNQHCLCSSCAELTQECPICKQKTKYIPALLLRQMVDKLEISCEGPGCEAKMPIESYAGHHAECPNVLVDCPNAKRGCFVRVQRHKLEYHKAEECLFQMVQCGQCGQRVMRDETKNHSCVNYFKELTAQLHAQNQVLQARNSALEHRMVVGEQEKATLIGMIEMLRVDPVVTALPAAAAAAQASGAPLTQFLPSDQRAPSSKQRKRKKVADNDSEDLAPKYLVVSPAGSTTATAAGDMAGSALASDSTTFASTATAGDGTGLAAAGSAPVSAAIIPSGVQALGAIGSGASAAGVDRTTAAGMLSEMTIEIDMDPNRFLFIFGGYDGSSGLSSMERYDGRAWRTHQVMGKVLKRSDCACAMYNNGVVVAGGRAKNQYLNSVEVWDGLEWRNLSKMIAKRAYFGFCVLNGCLYAAGGNSGRQDLDTVECYDPIRQKWKYVQKLTGPRSGLALAELNGALYAIGGAEVVLALDTCERYTPNEGWTPAPPLNIARSGTGVIVFKGQIYVIGGIGIDGAFLSAVERFNGTTWELAPPMITRRNTPSVAVYRGCIYVMGGYNNTAGLLESVERFDGYSWTPVHPMSNRRSGASGFSLSIPN